MAHSGDSYIQYSIISKSKFLMNFKNASYRNLQLCPGSARTVSMAYRPALFFFFSNDVMKDGEWHLLPIYLS